MPFAANVPKSVLNSDENKENVLVDSNYTCFICVMCMYEKINLTYIDQMVIYKTRCV